MKPLHYYLFGTGAWFLSFGIQNVTFTWLVTMVLQSSPQLVGTAQMTMLIPALLFMLVGGSLADQYGGRTVIIPAQLVAAVAPFILITVIATDHLSFGVMLLFAAIMGSAQAFVTPARDSLLYLVADGRIQRRVVQTSLIQFSIQMFGFMIASFADTIGATVILTVQSLSLLTGVAAYYLMGSKFSGGYPLPSSSRHNIVKEIVSSITEGFHTVNGSGAMRAVVIQNCAMGLFFMGSYIVTLPILVREMYAGSSSELSWMNSANALGLVISIMFLLRFGDLARQGRALQLAQGIGSFALAGAGLGLGFNSLVLCVFAWGLCGGVAMTMSRTIMQEHAPLDQRGRMMAFYSFSFMGSGPLGALLCGFLVEHLGPEYALLIASASMFAVVVTISARSRLWKLDARELVISN
ncbi:MAG: MFS transporter [Pseudomonadales bacterium]|jgi:MFS family permease|nr:MFS transporter [Pseudomonadales bacterium]MDP7594132.1 MFS transporter [Pseudomonadales bacterium]HJN49437.1 MFS transporter [Pseudomonadales bacterium]|tara:strand:- start:4712 stop:5938 length:1227 start_codon:yes stop_codon:yes gene_type:complete